MKQIDSDQWVSDDGQWTWDGSAWRTSQAPPSPPPRPDATHPLSPDGGAWWDGGRWVPVVDSTARSPAPAPAAEVAPAPVAEVAPTPGPSPLPPRPPDDHPLSDDGHWRWSGTAWEAVEAPPGGSNGQRSADGRWVWDGTSWVAAQSDGQSVDQLVAHGMPTSADGYWVWDGESWKPTGK